MLRRSGLARDTLRRGAELRRSGLARDTRRRGAMHISVIPIAPGSKFQSAPPVAEGRCDSGLSTSTPILAFQSAPPVAEGRCGHPGRNVAHQKRFNPRPPSPRGDALLPMPGQTLHGRFNPRPPSPRGDAYTAPAHHELQDVSIRAPRRRGAMLEAGVLGMLERMFQSAPPVAEGRCERG